MNQPSLKKMTGLGAPIAPQDLLASIFSSDEAVILAAADYLKAYAIDCMFTAIFSATPDFIMESAGRDLSCFRESSEPLVSVFRCPIL